MGCWAKTRPKPAKRQGFTIHPGRLPFGKRPVVIWSAIDRMDKPDPKTAFEKVWGQALLAVSTAEEEAGKALGKVAEVYGWSQDEVKRHVREFADKLASQRR